MPIINRSDWEALEPLLDQAMDLSPEERTRWLQDLSSRSPVLATELSAFLADEVAADQQGFLDRLPDVSLSGIELGAYRLEHPLGQGGMGTVWLARRTDGRFEGVAALKLLNLALVNPTVQERFRREGSVLARLAHPGIARLLDAGVSATGQPYLVLEHVDGIPIDEYSQRHQLDRTQRIQLFLQVLDAVGHAHANLIVHRDLKPSNILVNADGVVKLLDFGIAKLLDTETGGDRTALTMEGGRIFTPLYAAPEQVRGETLTTATDVYALGVLLYVLVAGRHPTAGKSRTPGETVQALLEKEPSKVGAGDLDTILGKTLSKQPSKRYQTVAAFSDDLRRYLRRQPISARPSSIGYRLGKFVRRHVLATAASLTVVAVLIAATLFSLAQAREATRERDRALRESQRADAVLSFQRALLSQIGDQPTTMSELTARGLTLLEQRQSGDPVLETDVAVEFAGMYGDLGQRDKTRALMDRAERFALASGDAALLMSVECRVARFLADIGQGDSALVKLARFQSTPHPDLDPPDLAMCIDAKAGIAGGEGQADSAVLYYQQAIEVLERNHLTRTRGYFSTLAQLGFAHQDRGEHRETLRLLHRSWAAADTMGLQETPGGINIYSQFALPLMMLGEMVEADSITLRSMKLLEANRIDQRRSVVYVTNRAAVTQLLGLQDSALKYFSQLAVLTERAPPGMRRRALVGLGRAQAAEGQIIDARRTLALVRSLRDSAHVVSREEDHLTGWVRAAEDDLDAADSAFTRVLTRDGYFQGNSANPGTRQVLLAAGDVALRLGDASRALQFARDARKVATLDSVTETQSGYIGDARYLEVRALLVQGDSIPARIVLAQALPALRYGYGPNHFRTRAAEELWSRLRTAPAR